MSKEITPSSLDGIKRLAKSIKKQTNSQHVEALNKAAREAHYENYEHARKILSKTQNAKLAYKDLFLTAYWRNRDTNESGRENLKLSLGSLWEELISHPQFKINRGLADFRASGPDHLEYRYSSRSQSEARKIVCAASRNLQFMQATGLRPTVSRKVYPRSEYLHGMPGADHTSGWYDPITKKYLFVAEPFSAGDISGEMETWAREHGQDIAISSWPGMYNPPYSSLYLTSDLIKGIPLSPVLRALEKLPPPLIEENWTGESVPFKVFVSPGALAKDKASREKLKANPPKVRTGPLTTLGYLKLSGEQSRRPKGQLSVEMHGQIGKSLTSVLADTLQRKSVTSRLEDVRQKLEEWVSKEYSETELPKNELEDIYYHYFELNFIDAINKETRDMHVRSLNKAITILTQYYPECPPVNALVKKLNGAINSMQSWKLSLKIKS